MNKEKKHSPLKNQPLRNPGQSLDEKRQDIIAEDIYPSVVAILFLIIFAIKEWLTQVFNILPSPWLLTFIALVASVYYAKKLIHAWRKIQDINLGRDGEKVVGQSLEKLRKMRYEVFHDIINVEKGFNIDHIIVGPAGVFTIETKTRSKANGIRNIKRDGDIVRIDGIPDSQIIFQAKSQARWLESFLLDSTAMKMSVMPVVIFPGWFTEPQSRNSDVWVLNPKALPTFLQNEPVILDDEKIGLISAQIAKYNRKG